MIASTTEGFRSHGMVGTEERDLIARVVAGDREAERLLYDRHAARVYRLAYRITGDADLALDAVQETFIRVFRDLARFEARSTLATWIHSVAVSTTQNVARREHRHRKAEPLQAAAAAHPAVDHDHALREHIERMVDGLGDDLRIVFIMADLEGFSHEEIATALGISPNASRIRLSRARQQLRRALTPIVRDSHD